MALEEKLLNQELFEEFCEEFTREMNRLRGEHRVNLVAGERELARALQEPETRSEATEVLRDLVDAIVLTPDQGGETLQIDLRGNLATMLRTTVQTKRSPESDDLSLQVSLVAGLATSGTS
jgi:hypothetical protein